MYFVCHSGTVCDVCRCYSLGKQKGLDKEKIKQMILQYLKNAGTDGAKRDSIYEYVKDVMPQVKTHEQQLRLLGDILSALSTDKLIYPKGRTWFLKE